jgi:hypothetical protein
MKNPNDPNENRTHDLPVVGHCLNQLRYPIPPSGPLSVKPPKLWTLMGIIAHLLHLDLRMFPEDPPEEVCTGRCLLHIKQGLPEQTASKSKFCHFLTQTLNTKLRRNP